MSTFTLAISCLTTSNMPWFMDLTFQVPMQYCSLQHQNLLPSPVTSTSGCCFFLWLHPFILSGVNSPMISSSILGTYKPVEFIFHCPIFLPFHSVHGVLKAGILKWFAVPFSIGPCFVRTALHGMAHNFTELDKALVHVIRLVSYLWLWFSVVCPLMEKDKRRMETSLWERLTEGETGSCSAGWDHAQ